MFINATKKYTEEFKKQIVYLYNMGNKSLTELEGEYDVSNSTMNEWIKKLSPVKVPETETITMKEYQALQKKMRELELENEILYPKGHSKKALAIFEKSYRRSCKIYQ